LGLERTYSSFEAGGYHFVILDSIQATGDGDGYRGFVEAEQIDWLSADIARVPRGRPVVAVTHLPLVTAFFGHPEPGGGPSNRVVLNATEVLKVLGRRRLILVLQAHLHTSEAFEQRGTTFLCGGAICGQWWRMDRDGTPPGFTVVSLNGERVDWEYVRYRLPANA
jgi:3',5'-cyclic-AMP phosphodiesterase